MSGRLGCQGVELLETGRVTLPMPEPWRGAALAIRQGKTLLPVVTAAIGSFEERLTALLETSPLPDEPDYDRINRFLVEAYRDYWIESGELDVDDYTEHPVDRMLGVS